MTHRDKEFAIEEQTLQALTAQLYTKLIILGK